MRVIKVDLPATLRSTDPNITLASDEIRAQLFKELKALDYELSELVRQRAAGYFPPSYSVFVRTQLAPDRIGTLTELWIVDPNIRWPAGLLTRSAWSLFVPVLANVVKETTMQRFQALDVEMNEKDARVTVLAPTRSWRDPVLLSGAVFVATTLFWLVASPWLRGALKGLWPF
jgi:hypothetical protein